LAAAQKELASTTAKLSNPNFRSKAPVAEIDKQRRRQRVAREEADRITARLAGFSRG
jgi:valyl-tRNA synthetase